MWNKGLGNGLASPHSSQVFFIGFQDGRNDGATSICTQKTQQHYQNIPPCSIPTQTWRYPRGFSVRKQLHWAIFNQAASQALRDILLKDVKARTEHWQENSQIVLTTDWRSVEEHTL